MKTVLLQSSRLVSVVLFMLYGMSMFAQRQDILLNNDWNFRFSHQVQKGTGVRVDLPHTWNAQDLSLIHIFGFRRMAYQRGSVYETFELCSFELEIAWFLG